MKITQLQYDHQSQTWMASQDHDHWTLPSRFDGTPDASLENLSQGVYEHAPDWIERTDWIELL